MLGNISILLLLFVTLVLLVAGVVSVILGIVKRQNKKIFIVRGAVLSVLCLIILALLYVFTDALARLSF